jgi:hypothetical protein
MMPPLLRGTRMIAPRQMYELPPTRPAREARKLALSLLDVSRRQQPAPVPAWQGWLLTGWVLLVAGSYAAILLGLWNRSP